MAEQVRSAPQQPHGRGLHLFAEVVGDGVEVFERLGERFAFGRNVAVMKGVERQSEDTEEIERRVGFVFRRLDRVRACHPGGA